VESFKFSRGWLRAEAMRLWGRRSSSVVRRLNLPPSYVLIHRASKAGVGVLCQLECEGPFRAEVLKWMPGYTDPAKAALPPQPASAQPARATESSQPVRPTWPARAAQPAESGPAAVILGDLVGLVAEVREAGVEVEVRIDGNLAAIPKGLSQSAYRIVQECLTNVLMHARAHRVEVSLRCRGPWHRNRSH
jgi:hypothetical protein